MKVKDAYENIRKVERMCKNVEKLNKYLSTLDEDTVKTIEDLANLDTTLFQLVGSIQLLVEDIRKDMVESVESAEIFEDRKIPVNLNLINL